MQELSDLDRSTIVEMKKSLSHSRFQKYLNAAASDENLAIQVYCWNAALSQSLYLNLHYWEVCLRNKINKVLVNKYGHAWPYHKGIDRNLQKHDRENLDSTKKRQQRKRGITRVSTDIVVSDLSAGFWVSQLSRSYEAQYHWPKIHSIIVPNDSSLERQDVHAVCSELLTLRNRIAHHEPIFNLELERLHDEMEAFISAMCEGTSHFSKTSCSFRSVFDQKPL